MTQFIPLASQGYQDPVEWAESTIIIPSYMSAPGPLKLWPMQSGILRAFTDPQNRRLTLMISSQLTKSMLMAIMILYVAANRPFPMFFASATGDAVQKFFKQNLYPYINANQALRKIIPPPKSSNHSDPLRELRYRGGPMHTATAASVAGMAQVTTRYAFVDEVDACVRETAGDTSPISKAKHRTTTYGANGKLILASTPTIEGKSEINKQYLQGSQEQFYVPCTHCGHFQTLEIENVSRGQLICTNCTESWSDHDRKQSLRAGEWRPSNPDAYPRHRSFHANQFYHPFKSVEETMDDRSIYTEMDFRNYVLALSYVDKTVKTPEPHELQHLYRNPPGLNPDKVTCAIDVQRGRYERLEFMIVHWYEDRPHIHTLKRVYLTESDNDRDTMWRNCAGYIREHEPAMTFVDCGDQPEMVFTMVNRHFQLERAETASNSKTGIRFIRGDSADKGSHGQPYIKADSKDVITLSVDAIKNDALVHLVEGTMSINPDRKAYPEDLLDQLTAESLIEETTKTGKRRKKWKPRSGARNEAWDLLIYNMGVNKFVGETESMDPAFLEAVMFN